MSRGESLLKTFKRESNACVRGWRKWVLRPHQKVIFNLEFQLNHFRSAIGAHCSSVSTFIVSRRFKLSYQIKLSNQFCASRNAISKCLFLVNKVIHTRVCHSSKRTSERRFHLIRKIFSWSLFAQVVFLYLFCWLWRNYLSAFDDGSAINSDTLSLKALNFCLVREVSDRVKALTDVLYD